MPGTVLAANNTNLNPKKTQQLKICKGKNSISYYVLQQKNIRLFLLHLQEEETSYNTANLIMYLNIKIHGTTLVTPVYILCVTQDHSDNSELQSNFWVFCFTNVSLLQNKIGNCCTSKSVSFGSCHSFSIFPAEAREPAASRVSYQTMGYLKSYMGY